MTEDQFRIAADKLRLHIKANPALASKIADAIGDACKGIRLDVPKEFYSKLLIIHESEMSTTFSVPVLPVGSQCGL